MRISNLLLTIGVLVSGLMNSGCIGDFDFDWKRRNLVGSSDSYNDSPDNNYNPTNNTTGAVGGRVFGADSTGTVADVTVALWGGKLTDTIYCVTNISGKYIFKDLWIGVLIEEDSVNFIISATHDDYTYYIDTVSISNRKPLASHYIYLTPDR